MSTFDSTREKLLEALVSSQREADSRLSRNKIPPDLYCAVRLLSYEIKELFLFWLIYLLFQTINQSVRAGWTCNGFAWSSI